MAPHSSTLAWQIPWTEKPWWAAVHGVAKNQTQLSDFAFTFHFHALEKEMATHSSVLAWSIPGTGEPGGLPSMGSHRVGHDCSSSSSLHLFNSFNWFIHLTLKLCVFLLICFLLYAFISLLWLFTCSSLAVSWFSSSQHSLKKKKVVHRTSNVGEIHYADIL